MRKHEDIFGQVSRLAVAVALCIAAMLAVYALAGRFTNTVLLGALIGFVLAMGNFISLCITVSNALDRTVKGDNPQKAQLQIQSSGVIRLVVLVIIGILVLIALPNLMPLISRAKSTEAQQQLVFLHTLEKNNFYTYSKYSPSLEELGFEQQPLVTEGGHANYRIEIVEASERGFRATATAVVDFDGDGEYNVWEIDQDKNLKETVKD